MSAIKAFRGLKLVTLVMGVWHGGLMAAPDTHWFEQFKAEASDADLYTFLYAMPKGGDLHHHITGTALSEWWYELALKQREHGYRYYTKVTINNCNGYGGNEFSFSPYLLHFHNVLESSYNKLSDCEKSEYKRLEQLNAVEKQAWLNSIRLDAAHEGRDEFFQTHWQRLDELMRSPYLIADILVKNMQAFGAEGLIYMESMMGASGYTDPNGKPISPDTVADIYRDRLQQPDAKATGVTVRMQESILRFAGNAEDQLRHYFDFVSRNNDLYLAVNMVGREDNDKGHPLRFKDTLRELRRHYNNVKLSIHAGEVDEPNFHIRDTLLLGADRIGHGVNLIDDDELLRQLRYGPYLIEINLISNLLLEYIERYDQHPFPEYLRLGVPVALSTDDRGMWDSNITDEFFVAVKEFNLSWDELKQLSHNSLAYSFIDADSKARLVERLNQRLADFENAVEDNQKAALKDVKPVSYSFICKQYQLCQFGSASR
ncbi:adenosine deaminase [Neiella marina]|uniref:Adenosine deaminase n=2 Tax=Neiella holothuriorum TaxID=2870530 RepID=A0ABS7EBT9_9GAMM|nr:adenosine deaminase [Neiella holothuriorum]